MAVYRKMQARLEGEVAELRLEELERLARSKNGSSLPLKDWIALAEAWRIAQALRDARGNRSAAARALGIGRRTLYSKMDKLGLVPSWGIARRPDAMAADATPALHAEGRDANPAQELSQDLPQD